MPKWGPGRCNHTLNAKHIYTHAHPHSYFIHGSFYKLITLFLADMQATCLYRFLIFIYFFRQIKFTSDWNGTFQLIYFVKKAVVLFHYSFISFKYEAILQSKLLVKSFLKSKNTCAHMHICMHSSLILQTDHFAFKTTFTGFYFLRQHINVFPK